jgi:hypothetical protein
VAGASVASAAYPSNADRHGAGATDPAVPRPHVAAFGAQVADEEPLVSTPAPWELIHPLALGASLGHGWRIAGLHAVIDGSCVVTVENERGRTQRVHLCRNDGHPNGLVHTEQFDLVVMNGGQGDLPTEEGLAQAVAEVAHVLASNESDPRFAPLMTALLSQAERVRAFSSSAGQRLR